MKSIKYNLSILLLMFCLLFWDGCTNDVADHSDSLHTDTTTSANKAFTTRDLLSDSMSEIILNGKFSSNGIYDSLLVDEQTIIYDLGINEESKKIFLWLSEIGIGSGGCNMDIVVLDSGRLFSIQNIFARFDGIGSAYKNTFTINVLYRDALFEPSRPASYNYQWNGIHYAIAQINYVTSSSRLNYSGSLLDVLDIIPDSSFTEEYPYVKLTEQMKRFNINNIAVDTFQVNNEVRLLLFKNKCSDGVSADYIWLIRESKDKYFLEAESESLDRSEVEVEKNAEGYPEIIFGTTLIRRNNNSYSKSTRNTR